MIRKILNNKVIKKTIEIVCIVGLSTIINTSLQGNKIQNNIVSAQAQTTSNKSLVQDDEELKNIIEGCLIDSNLKISEVGKTPSNNSFIDLNNGSWIVYDLKNNEIIFQPIELGDWDYSFNNIEDAKACITTYVNNFPKDNLITNIEAKEVNTNDDNNNNDNSTLKTNNTTAKEAKEVNTVNENTFIAEKGNNTNNTLENDLTIEENNNTNENNNNKINNTTNNDNKEYTEEDYNKYLEYKNSLIEEYGDETYNLMNQEAGISSEEESFIHYMEYGI